MQGLGLGRQSASEFLIPAGAVNVEGNFTVNGERSSLHSSNNQMVKSIDQQRGNYNFDLNFGEGQRTLRVQMTGRLAGSPPRASFTPAGGKFECACKNCTTLTVTSTTTDADNDVQNLSWIVDDQVAPPFDRTLPLELTVGTHSVRLVATDTRAAATGMSATFDVVDTKPPVLTVPPDVTFRSCDYPDIGRATAVDACSEAFIVSNDPGDFASGVTNVTWRAEDEAGNVSTGIQRVRVNAVPDANCCPAGYNIILGTQLADTLIGTDGNDCIVGFDGNDVIDGLSGDDYIVGGNAQDRLVGGSGDDVILGGEGDDILDGGEGLNRISAGGGQDVITGGTAADKLRGGRGDDRIFAGDGDDEVIGGEGQDVIYGGPGNDLLEGSAGGDNQRLLGGEGDDLLSGGVTQDRLEGNEGNDVLIGTDGDDLLEGGPGNDLLAAGNGHNRCVAGGGDDRYIQCEVQQ
jgi:Ca2+-binding RTX toxin-like protein